MWGMFVRVKGGGDVVDVGYVCTYAEWGNRRQRKRNRQLW